MLITPDCDISQLVGRLRLSESEIRSALDKLCSLALLRPSPGLPSGMRVVSPDVGLEVLLAQQQATLAAYTHRIEESRAAAARLIAEFGDLRPSGAIPHVEHLVGLDAIRNDPATTDYLSWLVERGAAVRTAPSLPVRMIIIDHGTVVIPVDPTRADQGAIVSPRTARRIAAELMSKLGARSRFQAGVYAVQDGLLPDMR
jgi:hypothetical protein